MSDLERVKDEIKRAATCDKVFEHYGVELRRNGSSWKCCCPFHEEKTPSCLVHDEYFKCFGCQAGGDVFEFVMRREGLPFMEALKQLSEFTRIPLPAVDPAAAAKAQEVRERRRTHTEILEAANAFYRRCLSEVPEALAYARGRGLTDELIERFEVGYAPRAHAALRDWGATHGITLQQLHEVGLWGCKTGQSPNQGYARFRDRIMFPIRDARGLLVGFSGRIIPNNDGSKTIAKYINTPETELFQKGRLLFGLFQSRPEIQKSRHAILVEGQIDVIACHRCGFLNAVGPLGTAFTEDHAAELARFAERVTLVFDGDEAGRKATERAIELLFVHKLQIYVAALPEGADPDNLCEVEDGE